MPAARRSTYSSQMMIPRLVSMLLLAVVAILTLAARPVAASIDWDSIEKRDALTTITEPSNAGENHSPLVAPRGSVFTSVPVGTQGTSMPVFWTASPKNSRVKHAFIMIHGRRRDGGPYWTIMNDILQQAIQQRVPGVDPNSIIAAPQFLSAKYNSGQYSPGQMAWGDTNTWMAGEVATQPQGTRYTAFDALDAIVAEFSNSRKYPLLRNITVIGHGGGGQLSQRYATVARSRSSSRQHIRYIHGDPSSCAYFTGHRPRSMSSGYKIPPKSTCEYFDTWRYGFDNFTGTADGLLTQKQYFTQYLTRDVVSVVGLDDVKPNGDVSCMANLQGGTRRRDRNLAWWQYVNTLARTKEDLTGFPATYGNLPDWSYLVGGKIQLQLVVVQNAGHDAKAVFSSKEGQAALFSKGPLPKGWRPKR